MARPRKKPDAGGPGEAPPPEASPPAEQLDADEDCRIDGAADGSFNLRRRRRAPEDREDRDAGDLPDEPPPGWCGL